MASPEAEQLKAMLLQIAEAIDPDVEVTIEQQREHAEGFA